MLSKKNSYESMFSHIYIEKRAVGTTVADSILNKLPDSRIIGINHYKDVFNRPSQNPCEQKESKKLILAVNEGTRVYPGAPYCHDFGASAFFYTSQALNCPYDCSYCYLKGKFPTANIVVFVNTGDYFRDIESAAGDKPAFITLSYDSDLHALEPLLNLSHPWHEFISSHPALTFEMRSKSMYFPAHEPLPNLIYAVSLLPQKVIDLYEDKTPPLESRLMLINKLLVKGHRVRLSIDPILDIRDHREIYGDFISTLAGAVPLDRITDISAGCFRIPADYYKNMCRGYGDHFIHWYPFDRKDGRIRYNAVMEKELLASVAEPLAMHIDESKIYTR